jgi:hypothetical protein
MNNSYNLIYKENRSMKKFVLTFGICKVGDCGFQTNQTVTKLKRATATKFSTITPILYIHCWLLRFISYLHSCF